MKNKLNVLLILTDDQGWDDFSCHGNPCLETPEIDKLAVQSVQFDNFYVASVCAPSRASMLTGRHFLRTGVSHVHGGKDFIHRDETLLSEAFQNGGYHTAMWGKWHSGKTTGYLPWERGFDEAYHARLYIHKESNGYLNGDFVEHSGWTVDTLTDYAISFLEKRAKDAKPFFAHIPYLTCHSPLVADEILIDKYEAKGVSKALATLYAMIEQLDSNIGRLLNTLDDTGLAENTLVVFLSDNGPACLESEFTDDDRERRNINAYKGHKGNMWENGIKSPLFIRFPDGRNQTVKRLCDICDLYPTLLELCEIELPEKQLPLDGRSIVSYLDGDEDSLPPKESYIWVNPGWPPDPVRGHNIFGVHNEYGPIPPEEKIQLESLKELAGVRTEKWKFMQNPGSVPHMPEVFDSQVLFHISEDPKEDINLAGEELEKTKTMRGKVLDWFEEIKQEPHSFHMPELTIGVDHPETFLPAYAPVRIRGGLHNTGNSLRNWKNHGDAADYDVIVSKNGRYRVTVDLDIKEEACLRLIAENDSIDVLLSADGFKEMGVIELNAGKQVIKLELQNGQIAGISMLHFIATKDID